MGGTFEGGPGGDRVELMRNCVFDGGAANDTVRLMHGGEFLGGADNDSVTQIMAAGDLTVVSAPTR